jgi:three-Cys-motif partner protein
MIEKKEIDLLRSRPNNNCKRNCTQEDRKLITEEGICKETFSVIDGEIIRCSGAWSYEKIYWLTRYFSIFARGMSKKWGLNYIEICSGPGRCILRENGQEIDGTSLSILNHDFFGYFKKAIFIDNNSDAIGALNRRIRSLGKQSIAEGVIGDYNDVDRIKEILSGAPERCLNLVFIDPTDCSIPFALIEVIDNVLINVDFIINVAIGTDISRNIRQAVLDTHYEKVRTKYVGFLGSPDYFKKAEVVAAAKDDDHKKMRLLFMTEYKKRLGSIRYIYTDTERVEHYYDLLFASKHKKGLEFWHKAQREEPSGQRRFDL